MNKEKERKSNRICFRMTPTEAEKLNSVSSELNVNISVLVRNAIKKEYDL